MLKRLRSFLSGKAGSAGEPDTTGKDEPGPQSLQFEGGPPFPLCSHITYVHRFPYLDWDAVQSWVDGFPSSQLQAQA